MLLVMFEKCDGACKLNFDFFKSKQKIFEKKKKKKKAQNKRQFKPFEIL